MYLVCEGVVGTGKTTQSKKIVDRLQKTYPTQEVLRIREPGGTQIAEAIRMFVQGTQFDEPMHALTDVYLYAAARAQLLGAVVKPALARGAWVVSDRNVCSSLSYQGWTQGVGMDKVRQINAPAVIDVLPTKILFFDLPVKVGLERTFDAAGDKRETKGADFFDRAYEGYTKIPELTSLGELFDRVDVAGTPEVVFAKLQQIITSILFGKYGKTFVLGNFL